MAALTLNLILLFKIKGFNKLLKIYQVHINKRNTVKYFPHGDSVPQNA